MNNLSRNKRHNAKERNAGIIFIYTEGNVTEPEYLKDWIAYYAQKNNINPIKANTKFKIIPSNDKSEPLKIIQNIIEREDIFNKELDMSYAVFDEDDRSQNSTEKNNFQKAFAEAAKHNIKIICSNRSVELWALMHFSEKTPTAKNDLEKELKKYLPKYSSNKNKRFDIVAMLANDNENQAIKRAKSLRETNAKSSKNPWVRPSTNFDELIEVMRKALLTN